MGEHLQGVSEAASRLNYGLTLYTQGNSPDPEVRFARILPLLKSGLADGVLTVVPQDYEMFVSACQENGLPYVIIEPPDQHLDEPYVSVANCRGVLEKWIEAEVIEF
jgi:DNA-binding LacI/PurR family transcriptional regulator